jgi:hypothetical protein
MLKRVKKIWSAARAGYTLSSTEQRWETVLLTVWLKGLMRHASDFTANALISDFNTHFKPPILQQTRQKIADDVYWESCYDAH